MKFYCDQCSAKYSIPDEKVRGKVVKVRCKECDHVITVRGSQRKKTGTDDASRGTGASTSRSSDQSRSVQWYYSLKGETYGPHSESELRKQYRQGDIPRASYVWRDGFSDWKPAEDVEPFAGAIDEATGSSDKPERKKTQGVGGDALEAIEPVEEQTDSQATGTASSGNDTDGTAPSARTGGESESSTRSTDKGTGRAERLERLRDRLQTSFAEDESGSHEPAADDDVTVERTREAGGSVDDTKETSRSAVDEIDVDVQSALGDEAESDDESPEQAVEKPAVDDRTTTEDGLGPADPSVSADDESELSVDMQTGADAAPSTQDDDTDLPPAGSDRLGDAADDVVGAQQGEPAGAPEPDDDPGVDVESHDGLFDDIDQQAGPEATGGMVDATGPETDTGGDTDIPTTPKLGDDDDESTSLRDSVSESLLIQIDNIKKTDRSQYYKWGGVAALLIALMGGVWWYLYNPNAANDLFGGAEREESRTAIAGNEGGLEFQTYSEDEVVNFGATKVPKNPDESGGEPAGSAGGGATGGKTGSTNSGGAESSGSETLTGGTESLFAEDDEDLEKALAKSNRQEARAGGGESSGSTGSSGSSSQGAVAAEASSSGSESSDGKDPFAGLDEIDSPTAGSSSGGPNIEAPEDNLGKEKEASSLSSQLSKERISRAIRNVSKSVGTCRQRHARHGAPLDAKKVTIVFTVQRDGRVSAFQLNPKSVRNSRFEKCLQARKGRWNFGPIPNAPQQMKAPFILQ